MVPNSARQIVMIHRTFLQKLWIAISVITVNILMRLFTRVEIQGRENIPRGGGVLFAANHCSALDVLLIPMAVFTRWPMTPIEFMMSPAKERFFRIPVIGAILRSWGVFSINQGTRDFVSIGKFVELLKTERIMLFPEGTRSPDGQLQPGMRSAGWLIHKGQPLVIPAALFGTEKVWPKQCILPRPYGRVKVVFGKPVNLDRYYDQPLSREVAQEVVDEIMAAIAHIKTAARPVWDTSPL